MNAQQTTANWNRFLLTGCDSGVYRAASYHPVPERAQSVLDALKDHGPKAIDQLLAHPGARPEAALFALALAASPRFADTETVSRALAALPLIARKAHELLTFAEYAGSMRGWGRALRTAVAHWYISQPAGNLAAQILRQLLILRRQ